MMPAVYLQIDQQKDKSVCVFACACVKGSRWLLLREIVQGEDEKQRGRTTIHSFIYPTSIY